MTYIFIMDKFSREIHQKVEKHFELDSTPFLFFFYKKSTQCACKTFVLKSRN